MVKGNDGNLLQHTIEAETASWLTTDAKKLHVVITHGMAPFEEFEPRKNPSYIKLLDDWLEKSQDPDATAQPKILNAYRSTNATPTHYPRIIESAGLKPWPKAFVNLWASCRTDLEEVFPAHVVNSWLGQSTAMVNRHYLQVTDAHWEKAVAAGTNGIAAECGGPISVNQASSGGISDDAENGKNPVKSDARGVEPVASVPPVGLEPTTNGLRVRCSTN